MRKIKLMFILLAAIIAIAAMPANVFAITGAGTESSPYIISSVSDLEYVKTNLSAYYKLGANITLSSAWTPIGTNEQPFTGYFDGNGHTVSGLKINQSGNSVYAGLFGYSTGDISHLKVVMADAGITVTATTQAYAGGVVGYNNGGTLETCEVVGKITANVSSSSNIAEVYAGLVAGRSSGDISSSDAIGNITATVTETSATGTAANNAQVYAGGIVGHSNADLHNNTSMVEVVATAAAASKYMAPKAYVGGIAGKNTGNVTECQTTGNASASAIGEALEAAAYAGGIIGFETGNVEISVAYGDVSAETSASAAKTYAGGLVGFISGNISKASAFGAATAESTATSDAVYAGGIAGLSYGQVSVSFATGTATATAANPYAGGLLGFADTAAVSSYYLENENYTTLPGCGIAKSEEELKLQETYEGWNFTTVWKIDEGENGGYPYLIDVADIPASFEDVTYTYDGNPKTIVATNYDENVTVTYTNNTATDAGVYRAIATLSADGYTITRLTANLIIEPIVLEISGLEVENKEYDNTTKATIDASKAVITGVLSGDEVAIDAENSVANFVTENVGDGRQVIISEIKLVGKDAHNYTTRTYYATADIYTGSYSHVEFEGSGTKEDPYIVNDEDELNAIRGNLDKHFRLANNITLKETWVPIGRINAPFVGSIDGNNCTISGISVDQSINYTYSGLFGYNLGEISNLNILISDDIFTTSSTVNIGAVAGYNGGTIKNCIVNGSISTSPVSTYVYVGGIAGYNEGTISGCDSNVEITAKGSTVYAGGVTGENVNLIEKTSSTGDVTVNDSLFAYAGGFVGINNSRIENSYARGNVQVNVSDTAFMVGAGGFAGRAETGTILKCYSTGGSDVSVSSGAYLLMEAVGGFTSFNEGILTSCYYDKTTSGHTDADKGTPKTTEELKTASTYVGWDFALWDLKEGTNDGYPHIDNDVNLTERALLSYNNKTVTISAYADITNATLIVASYSAGALVSLDFDEEFSIEKGETLTVTVKNDFKEIIGGSVKVMLWKDFASAQPLCTFKEEPIR